jgi:uncharacterized membrane protein
VIRLAFRFTSDQGGALSILTAALIVTLIAFAGVATDTASLFYWRHRLQSATDAAAMAAALDIGNGATVAAGRLQALGFQAGSMTSSQTGLYTDDPSLATASRFQAGAPSPNALLLNTSYQAPVYLMRLLTGNATTPINTSAIAYDLPLGGIAIESGTIDGDITQTNDILQQVSGSGTVQLSAAERDALDRTFVPLFRLIDGLAGAQGSNARTIAQVVGGTANLAQLAASASAALQAQSGTPSADTQTSITALNRLAQQGQGSKTVAVSDILAMTAHRQRAAQDLVSTASDALSAPALPLLEGYMQAAGDGQLIDIAPGLSIAGFGVSVELALARPSLLGQSATGTVAVGPAGTTVSSAAAHVRVTISLPPIPVLGATPINLPIVLTLGSGSATINDISCGQDLMASTNIAAGAQSSVGQAYIGVVSAANLENFSVPLSPASINLGLVQVGTSGNATILASPVTALTFDRADIAAGTAKRADGLSTTAAALNTLATNLQVTPNIPIVTNLVKTTIAAALNLILPTLGPTLDQVLASAGLRLGYMDVRATSVRCGIPALVN